MQKFFTELPESQKAVIVSDLIEATGITNEQALGILTQQNYFYRFDELTQQFKCLQMQQYSSLVDGIKYIIGL